MLVNNALRPDDVGPAAKPMTAGGAEEAKIPPVLFAGTDDRVRLYYEDGPVPGLRVVMIAPPGDLIALGRAGPPLLPAETVP